MTSTHPAFTLEQTHFIESLNVHLERYRHNATGAQHIHLASNSDENVFLVALRTVPEDSTGVAHILEHTALCGSQKYPVRDPFFMMIRRSLNTFMNAFTSSDWTAYPFASINRKDFDNLLSVYLDAVFFANLDELDFLQEGHRLEFKEADNPESDLCFKGVVYNEMKGAMSSVPSQLWQKLCKVVHPTNTYHYNSGGEPSDIPNLSYQQLKDFYQTHYHPSNAIFATFGNISAQEHHAVFEDNVLKQFSKSNAHIEVANEERYTEPKQFEDVYTAASNDDKSHVIVAWLLGESTDLVSSLRTQLIAALLYENSASPMQALLENSEYGSAPSPLNGIEDSHKEIMFVAGLEGCDHQDADAIEASIIERLREVANAPIDHERLEASLHQLELQQREIGGDSYPYGLQLILTALGSATHYGDPVDVLDLDRALKQLREDIKANDFVKRQIESLFLNNAHRVRLIVKPDTQLADREAAEETAKLEQIKAQLTPQQVQTIIEQTKALEARQNQPEDAELLPKVGIEDIAVEVTETEGEIKSIGDVRYHEYAAGTNGLVYTQLVYPMPALNEREQQLIPLLSHLVTELGLADQDYLTVQNRQTSVCGSIGFYTNLRATIDASQDCRAFAILSSKGLRKNIEPMVELLLDTAAAVRFDETKRIKDILTQVLARRESSVSSKGHVLAMNSAAAEISGLAQYHAMTTGLEGLVFMKQLVASLEDEAQLSQLAGEFQALYSKLTTAPSDILVIGEDESLQRMESALERLDRGNTESPIWSLKPKSQSKTKFWKINSTVNFCASAYPTVPSSHPDAAALTVLAGVLRNGFLHREIREKGGAYGGGATQDNGLASFKFYSYRDPRCKDTIEDFQRGIHWLIDNEVSFDQVEESILGVVSSLDKPASPAGEAKQSFYNVLHDRSPEFRREFRERILSVTTADLKRVANTYFVGVEPTVCVLGPESSLSELKDAVVYSL